MSKAYLNPKALFDSRQYGFSQIVTSSGGKTVYLSGQVGWDHQQKLTGSGDFEAQTWQTFKNIELAMQAAGGQLPDVVSLRIYFVQDYQNETHHISSGLKAFFPASQAPATTWIGVASLANSEFLIEIEAIGIVD